MKIHPQMASRTWGDTNEELFANQSVGPSRVSVEWEITELNKVLLLGPMSQQ